MAKWWFWGWNLGPYEMTLYQLKGNYSAWISPNQMSSLKEGLKGKQFSCWPWSFQAPQLWQNEFCQQAHEFRKGPWVSLGLSQDWPWLVPWEQVHDRQYEQRAQRSQAWTSDSWKWWNMNGCCFKLINLWQFGIQNRN